MLKDSLIRQPTEEDPDEGVKDLVDIALKKMVFMFVILYTFVLIQNIISSLNIHATVVIQDYDHDGKVSYADFKSTVRDENLLLEAFGNCLPHLKVKITSTFLWRENLAAFQWTKMLFCYSIF